MPAPDPDLITRRAALVSIDQLIDDMTLPEKLGQLTMTAADYAVTGPVVTGDASDDIRAGLVGNLLNLYGGPQVHAAQRLAVEGSRLKIPLLIGLDIIHGHRTMFPVPLAEAGLFDPEAWALTAREAAKEGAADGIAMAFAPMLDVSRDPRWGRTVEGPGEDPFLGAAIARAKVHGIQTDDLSRADALAAVAKHYCAYGPVTAGREYASVDISERTLREVHLPPFAAAVAAGVVAVMPAFTDLNGVPMTANGPMLRGVLRGELGFDGVIISDYNAIAELIHHGVATDLVDAAALALNAGIDIDMMSNAFRDGLPLALKRGLVSIAQIDQAVRRVLVLKTRLGLFDDPYRRGAAPETADTLIKRRTVARDVAVRSVVMLKNERAALPLSAKRIALIGPLADAAAEMRGPWWAAAKEDGNVSLRAGLETALPDAQILTVAGVAIEGDDIGGIEDALAALDDSDVIILCLGEAAVMSGEAASRSHPHLPGRQQELADAVFERAQGKPVVTVLFSGRPLVVPALIERSDAVLAAWFIGSEAGNALADIITGIASPSGRLAMSWPRAVGQIPIFFGERPSGRPADAENHFTSKYLDVPNTPQFPFGHGLTYGEFKISKLRLSACKVKISDTLEIRVDVANTGKRRAEETIFLFCRDKVARVARPLLELKGFGKISLAPNTVGTVTLPLAVADLQFLGPHLRPVFEPGEVEILVGPSADRSVLLSETVTLL